VFSIAMTFWGLATVPVVAYLYRRIATISRWGAEAGAFDLLVGCMGIILTGLFPTGTGLVFANLDWGRIHRGVGVLVMAGFGFGVAWYEILLIKDWYCVKWRGTNSCFTHKKFVLPYAVWWTIAGLATYFLVKWVFVYDKMKIAAAAAGKPLQSSWTEALNTRYSMPLWENLMLCTLYIFLVWFALSAPNEISGKT